MTSHERPGLLRRMLTALGAALRRGALGKSGRGHMKQFGGSDAYWDSAVAAQLGWPREQPAPPETGRAGSPETAPVPDGPTVRDEEYEPVHGWTRRQLDDYLVRNPLYRVPYEAEKLRRGRSGSPRD